jgi:cell division protein FtsB
MFILNLLKNKFFIVTTVFIVWVFFFAQYDILSLYKQREELKEMKSKIEYLEKEVTRLKAEKIKLKTDPVTLEKFAREKYYMKSPNEEVYVFDTVKKIILDSNQKK